MKNKGLYYQLTIVFALFFLVPLLAFIYFGIKYDILEDELTALFALAMLVSAFFGFTLVRKIFDDIRDTSKSISETIAKEITSGIPETATSELQEIIQSFHAIEKELHNNFHNLNKRLSQITTLKEMSDLCYVTFDAEDLFHITLERSLKLVNADIGSVLILEQPKRDAFIIKANIGFGENSHRGNRVVLADSIAKYAVINKSPLLVEDIEKDIRFGRSNRMRYGTKSFLCMPIKGMRDVIGVLSLSRRATDTPFTEEDVDVLDPLLSNAAFAYENLELQKKDETSKKHIKIIDDVYHLLMSSLRDAELYNAILKEIYADIPFDMALILIEAENNPGHVTVLDLMTTLPTSFTRRMDISYIGSIVDRVMKQGTRLLISDPEQWVHPLERELFVKNQLRACLLAPLKVDGSIKGVLVLGSLSPSVLQGVEEQVERLAGLVALANEKSRLSISILKKDQDMALIRQIGSLLAASTFDMQKVLEHTMDLIRATMDVEAGCLLLLDNNELGFNVAFNTDSKINMDSLRTMKFKLGQGIAGYCASRGEPVMVKDAHKAKQFSPEIDKQTGFTTRSVLCVPLISLGRVMGVIEVLNKRGGDFNDNDLRLLQSIATSVSIALENARLYQQTLSIAALERGIRNMFQKFVPKEVVDKITHDTDGEKPVINETKMLTLMNIDIRGFSTLSKRLGPQKTVNMLNHFFGVMGEIVFTHRGIVDKYLGDGFLAVFGAPVSDINDADNAVEAALEMRAAMNPINDRLAREFGAALTIGISIHTGEAVVGNIGFEKKMDYTVIGDSVNDVFRLQNLTRTVPNGILLSEKTLGALSSTRPEVREIGRCDAGETLRELKIYELLGCEHNGELSDLNPSPPLQV